VATSARATWNGAIAEVSRRAPPAGIQHTAAPNPPMDGAEGVSAVKPDVPVRIGPGAPARKKRHAWLTSGSGGKPALICSILRSAGQKTDIRDM